MAKAKPVKATKQATKPATKPAETPTPPSNVGSVGFEREGTPPPADQPAADGLQAAAPVAAAEKPKPGGIICNACSTEQLRVICTPVAPGWVQCPSCKVKQRNLQSLRAAMKARGGKSRAAR